MEDIDIKSILQNFGYPTRDAGNEIQSVCLYRGGRNYNLSINKRTGKWFDFVTRDGGNFDKLIKLIGGDQSQIDSFNFAILSNLEEAVEMPQVFDRSIADSLIKDYSYWNSRGISDKTCSLFCGGLANDETPKLKGRFITPIFNEKNQIEGFASRYTGKNPNVKKQKNIGQKKSWIYPMFLSRPYIQETKQIILVEGIADLFSVYECGFKNSLCLFGVKMFPKLLNSLIALDVQKIIISTNYDENGVGQGAAQEIRYQLLNYFDNNKIEIRLPEPWNDLNEALLKAGPDFVKELLG